MRLNELNGYLNKQLPDHSLERVEKVADANYVFFSCPKCHGTDKEHPLHLPFGDNKVSNQKGWNATGETINELTFVPPGSFSVRVVGGCNAHFFIKDGGITELT